MSATEVKKTAIATTGRRKQAVARVRLFKEGTGRFTINGKQWDEYFKTVAHRITVTQALEKAGVMGKVDVRATVVGGGITGQAGAIRLGLARALIRDNAELKAAFKEVKFLTRDPRAKERKKYGQKGPRAKFQWTKR
jgi:small subunit ribosomal protein S9